MRRFNDRRAFFVAREGVPLLLVMTGIVAIAWRFGGVQYASLPFALLVLLYLIFRDPRRDIPSVPLGVLSPVDGKVVDIGAGTGIAGEPVQRIVIRVLSLGTYTARSPVEGKIMDPRTLTLPAARNSSAGGLLVLTDENEHVILQFHGHRFGIPPRAIMRYGERVGQGQRCACLRLTKFATVTLPAGARIQLGEGQRVSAGEDVLALLPSP